MRESIRRAIIERVIFGFGVETRLSAVIFPAVKCSAHAWLSNSGLISLCERLRLMSFLHILNTKVIWCVTRIL